MEKSVEKFYGEHYKYMQRAMWCMDAAIGEAARFQKWRLYQLMDL